MKFSYIALTWIALALPNFLQAQQRHIIPITSEPHTKINTHPVHTEPTSSSITKKRRRFNQKPKQIQHSRIKKACIYIGYVLGALVGGVVLTFAALGAAIVIASLNTPIVKF